MAGARLIEYAEATPEVRAVFDDIKRTRTCWQRRQEQGEGQA